MSQDDLTVQFVENLIQNFLEDADVLYRILDCDAHKSGFTLKGEVVDVTVHRKPYVSAAGNILEKGNVVVDNLKKIETYLRGGTLAELQSVESNVQDDKVVEEKSNEGEGEPTQESCSEAQEEISVHGIEAIKEEEQEIEIGKWWNKNKDNWSWSGCIVGDDWEELQDDAKEELTKLYRRLDT